MLSRGYLLIDYALSERSLLSCDVDISQYLYIIQQSKWFSQSNLLINTQMRIVCIFSFCVPQDKQHRSQSEREKEGGGSDRGDTDTATDTDTAGDTRVLQTLDNGSGNGCVLCFVLFV